MRITNFVILAGFVLFSHSCLKQELPERFPISEITIKSRVSTNYEHPDSVTFMAFNHNGVLEYSGFMSQDGENVTLRTGDKRIFAFSSGVMEKVSVTALGDLRSLKHRFRDETLSKFGMFAEAGITVSEKQHPNISLEMKRYVGRIRLTGLANRLEPPLDDVAIRFLGVCLVNVPGTIFVDGKSDADCEYHIRRGMSGGKYVFARDTGFQISDCPELVIFDCRADNMMIEPRAFLDIPDHFLYSFPSSGAETLKIVVAVEIDGDVYYYPVDIGFIGMNESWEMNLDICRLGSSDPAVAVFDAQAASFSVDSFNDGPDLEIIF